MFLFLCPPLHCMCFLGFRLSCSAFYIFLGDFLPSLRDNYHVYMDGYLICISSSRTSDHTSTAGYSICIFYSISNSGCAQMSHHHPLSHCLAPGPQTTPTTFSPSCGPRGLGLPAPFTKIPKSESRLNPSSINHHLRRLVMICQFSSILSIPSVVP